MENISVTWRWIAGVLLGIALSIGSYMWVSMDSRVTAEENRSIEFKSSQAELHAMIELQYRDIVRRLDRIERQLDQSGVASNHGFPSTKR